MFTFSVTIASPETTLKDATGMAIEWVQQECERHSFTDVRRLSISKGPYGWRVSAQLY